jgi:hypothetical protein
VTTLAACLTGTRILHVEHFASTNANTARYPRYLSMWGETVKTPRDSFREIRRMIAAAKSLTVGSTVSAAGTTALFSSSAYQQYLTGSTTQTFTLPTSAVTAGMSWKFTNKSTGVLTVNASGGNLVASLAPGRTVIVTANTNTPTSAAHWDVAHQTLVNPATTSVVSAAGTTTLTIASPFQTFVTGSTTQNVALPTTSVVAGMSWQVVNHSTGAVTVRSSSGASILSIIAGCAITLAAKIDTPTAAADWTITNSPESVGSTGGATIVRDSLGNSFSRHFLQNGSSTATAAGTTALTTGTNPIQVFTGSTTQTVTLPASGTTSVLIGWTITVINKSSGAVTVNSSAGNLVATVAAGACGEFMANQNSPTAAAHWSILSNGGTA